LLLILFIIIPVTVYGAISGLEELNIDFTQKKDASTKATWQPIDCANCFIDITKEGLGYSESRCSSCLLSIKTIPLALGRAYQATQGSNIEAEVEPEATSTVIIDSTKNTRVLPPDIGLMYVRYSPDQKHWSTWQRMDEATSSREIPKTKPRKFKTIIQVPREQLQLWQKYWGEYIMQYSGDKYDGVKQMDQEAFAQWIIQKDPDFFQKTLPFIGYLQFLYEAELGQGVRIKRFHSQASWMIGGISVLNYEDPFFKEHGGSWRFKVE